MKAWFSHLAWLSFVAFALAGCGGGGQDPSASAAVTARPVEVPAVVTQVESYRQQPGSLALKRHVPLSRGSRPEAAMIRLPRLEAPKAAGLSPAVSGQPVKIGSAREISPTSDTQRMHGLLQFKPGAAGEGLTAAVSFTSPGAAGLRLGLRVRDLPDGARVRGYTQGGETVFEVSGRDIVAAIRRNRDAGDLSDHGRTWWTPVIDSEEVTLEIVLPVGASPDTVKVSVPILSHVSVKAQELEAVLAATAASCEADVSCYPEAADQSRATARMVFVVGGASYVCTGTLVNDAQSSGIPYFLSANHCISSQTAASTLITYWSFRSASCNTRLINPDMQQLIGGATLLYASTVTDTSFMRLNVPAPLSAIFAGWSALPPQPGQDLIAIHHPRGDLQKISRGILDGFINCTAPIAGSFNCAAATEGTGKYLSTTWSMGTVESGSSGSGLFAAIGNGRYLVGQLKGGSASCLDREGLTGYGRFDVAYNAALSRWLSPAQTFQAQAQALSPTTPRIPIHRFYNTSTGAHFFTPSAGERDYVVATYPWYKYEGVAFYAYAAQVVGSHPVYRLYNRDTGRHFFTMVSTERDSVLKDPAVTDEGAGWYAQWGSGGTGSPVYRFNNPATAAHFYTISDSERDLVLKNYPFFTPEGVAYYAWTTQ